MPPKPENHTPVHTKHPSFQITPLQVSLPTYAVVGSAALLGGFSRMLLSSSVLIMETAGADTLVVPLILTSLVAKVRW